MPAPDTYDHEIWRGNDSPLVVRFPQFDGSGSDFVLTMRFRGAEMVRRVSTGELSMLVAPHPLTGLTATTVTWPCGHAESRLLPAGRLTRYELERQVPGGEQRTFLQGFMIVREATNVD